MIAVLGVLNTEYGAAAKAEMLSWLAPYYDVIVVEQEPPGRLYEYPAIQAACDIAVKEDSPVLYLHTKGAGNPSPVQKTIREMWWVQFTKNQEAYFKQVDTAEPRISTPIMGPNKETWFNAFYVNPAAAAILLTKLKPDPNRYVFECIARDTEVEVVSPNGGPYVDAAIFKKLEELLHA